MSAKTATIPDTGDLQNGFLQKDGSLSIRGASPIIAPREAFLRAAADELLGQTFVVTDTQCAG